MFKELINSKKLEAFQEAAKLEKNLLVEGLWDVPKAVLASLLQMSTGKSILIITGKTSEENRLFDDFPFFYSGVVEDFPAWETLPSENIPPSPDIVGDRYKILKSLLGGGAHIVISSLQAVLQRLLPPKKLKKMLRVLKQGREVEFGGFIDYLSSIGYQRKSVASDKGEYSVRGGIIDVFPVSSTDPVRVEFWGDEIGSMRIYDPIGQKSVGEVSEVEITPAQEMEILRKEDKTSDLLDYMGKETVVIFDDIASIEDRYVSIEAIKGSVSKTFSGFHDFFDGLHEYQKIFWSCASAESLSDVRIFREEGNANGSSFQKISFDIFDRKLAVKRWFHPFQSLREYLSFAKGSPSGNLLGEELMLAVSQIPQESLNWRFLCPTDSDEAHLRRMFSDLGLDMPKNSLFKRGYLSSGFVLLDQNLAFVPLAEFTRRYKIRRQKQRSTYHSTLSEMHELAQGDYVVHFNAGIGKFQGIERQRSHNDIESEFFVVEYAEGAKMYVPFSQAHLISKYVGAKEEKLPKLHVMGASRWKKLRQQTERDIMGYASELLTLYAERKVREGFVYSSDSEEMLNFEKDFPYHETEDQLIAIGKIKENMMSKELMDCLVCGDVGYGKTEVAMRAAFKAVVDGGKQVAILVPTTVLAMQHYENFVERMWNFPVGIGVLSRFRSHKEVKSTIEGVSNGAIDILIGTHRILGKDISYKNLGLIVIDEEQRFGVRAKEYLKSMKKSVDCLTMSATPIPRTLYMSLLGAKDMSTIATPPQDRLPIKTIVCEDEDQVIRNALLRELTRDGQSYIIHNRVESIHMIADKIRSLIPQARVSVVHGQMSSEEIDTVFHAFKNGTVDILVATTIIESGIDIPNANTILINRADRYGLADLYQLRGRVGRWNRRAYAYFLTPKKQVLSPIARKRLEALIESGSGYGGGMKIAMRDLEIRGAGNILGVEQSGHVSSVGFHLYCKLLKRTIETLKGKIPSTICDTKLEFVQDARLPEEYVNATSLRLEIYQRFGEALSWEEVDRIMEEMEDRFGKAPEPVLYLYRITRIRVFASLNGITTLKINALSIVAERKKRGSVLTKKIPIWKAGSAEELEKKVIVALKKSFNS